MYYYYIIIIMICAEPAPRTPRRTRGYYIILYYIILYYILPARILRQPASVPIHKYITGVECGGVLAEEHLEYRLLPRALISLSLYISGSAVFNRRSSLTGMIDIRHQSTGQ
jgi:hypothetical protein